MTLAFSNVRSVQPLGETPEAYTVILDLDLGDGSGPQAVPYTARVNGGGISDAVIAWIERGEAPSLNTTYSKTRMFLAMTDDEYAAIEAAAAAAVAGGVVTARQMAAFNHAAELESTSSEFAIFRGLLDDTLGAARAAALLLKAEI